MTKVPFDWDLVLNSKVAVFLESNDDFRDFFIKLPDSAFWGHRTREVMMEYRSHGMEAFRFEGGHYVGEAYEETYRADNSTWPGFVFTVYEHHSIVSVEVGDLL